MLFIQIFWVILLFVFSAIFINEQNRKTQSQIEDAYLGSLVKDQKMAKKKSKEQGQRALLKQ